MEKINIRVILGILIVALLMMSYAEIMAYRDGVAYEDSIAVRLIAKKGMESNLAISSVNSSSMEIGHLGSHVVFAELGSVSWCPQCPHATEQMSKLFSMDNSSSFYYVTLAYDLNTIAAKRGRQLSDAYIPMLYLDGGYQVVDDITSYESAIDTLSNRETYHLKMDLSSQWRGDATIDITVSILNEDTKEYVGHLRVQMTEINSRWNNNNGDPFHYALLDYALDKYVRIPPGDKYVETATWKGSDSHGGQTYEDITQDNIMIIGTVSHWLPHLQSNPWTEPRPFRFLAQYVDETQATIPK